MIKKTFFVLLVSTVFYFVHAQEKSIDTVYIFDKQMSNIKGSHYVKRISNQDIQKNSTNLSEVLRFQTDVYIKESGRGMVASPSFRGTTAQQTAFVWNGINLNSMFLGQGDINNLSLLSYDDIDVVAGGSSVIYGSGAIGGSVHLNNHLKYKQGTKAQLFTEVGSFNTFNTALKANHSNRKWSVSVGVNHSKSDNDYEVSEEKYKNLNGQYKNIGANVGVGYKVNARHHFSGFYHWDKGEQHFPIFETTQTKTKYKTRHQRLLTAWDFKNNQFKNTLNFAYLNEEFDYFSDINQPRFSGGVGNTVLVKDDARFKLNTVFKLNFIGQYRYQTGEGYQSGIKQPKRNSGFLTSILKYQPNAKIGVDVGLKKEWNDIENAPFVYSLSARYRPSKWYIVMLNFSKNYRAPTFNDLYWNPGGNLNLKSETAHQISADQIVKYKNFRWKFSPYYMKIKDMIRWLPTSEGHWSPINTHEVESYGVSSHIKWKKKWSDWKAEIGLGYTYTRSLNMETKYQLSYVPKHKMNMNASVRYKNYSMYVQNLYTGTTFTETNENKKTALQEYIVTNLGVTARVHKNISLGCKVNNVANSIYETKAYFPLPKRNYAFHLTLKY